jgi:hypothetical protein
MLATASACTGCQTTLGPSIRPVRLLDLAFHDLCAPRCQACGQRLGGADQSRWRYSTRAVGGLPDDHVEPSAFWCSPCWSVGVGSASALS